MRRDVVDIDPNLPYAAFVGDLTTADMIRSDRFESFVLSKSLQSIYEIRNRIMRAYRMLYSGCVVRVLVPCVSRIAPIYGPATDFYRSFRASSCAVHFREGSGRDRAGVQPCGNVLTVITSLTGLTQVELSFHELVMQDSYYPTGFGSPLQPQLAGLPTQL